MARTVHQAELGAGNPVGQLPPRGDGGRTRHATRRNGKPGVVLTSVDASLISTRQLSAKFAEKLQACCQQPVNSGSTRCGVEG